MKHLMGTLLLAILATTSVAQQRAPVFADPTGKTSAPPAAPAQPTKSYRFSNPNPENLTATQQRCRNLDEQIARAEQQTRDATTTGSRDQFAQRRDQLLQQRARAGC